MATSTPATPKLAVWLLLALAIIALDQLTKLLVLQRFELGDAQPITGFFSLVRVHNTGAAFSFLAGASGWQRWFFVGLGLGAAVFIVWLLRTQAHQRLLAFSLALILGGALGNVIDRLLYGYVVDFLDFHLQGRHFPAFNVADAAISVGAALLVFDELRRMRRERRGAALRE